MKSTRFFIYSFALLVTFASCFSGATVSCESYFARTKIDQESFKRNRLEIESLPFAQKIEIKRKLALEIAKSEEFLAEEYTLVPLLALSDKAVYKISVNEYPEFALHYIAKDSHFRSLKNAHRILDFDEFRDYLAHNYWPLGSKRHDPRHIHWMTTHPEMAAVVHTMARSRNALRVTIFSGVFEGVDSFQYKFEQNLVNHFAKQGLTLEEALLNVMLADEAELNKLKEIAAAGTAKRFFNNALKQNQNWRPRESVEFAKTGHNKSLTDDLIQLIPKWNSHLTIPTLKTKLNYSHWPTKEGTDTPFDGFILIEKN